MKLLITSVGSLVGKNILDVLEHPGASRRALVTVIGTNSVAEAANNFRCDRCYLVPETVSADYDGRIRTILDEERPDLILCGRDADTLALSELRARHPDLPGALPVGEPRAALIGLDKWETFRFAGTNEPGQYTGTTAARFLLGMDELYLIVREFVPGAAFPEIRPPGSDICKHVVRDLVAVSIADVPVSTLKETGMWCRSSELMQARAVP